MAEAIEEIHETGEWSELRRLRLDAGLTVKELAGRTGLTASAIHKIETGRRIKIWDSTLIRLAEALGVTAAELDASRPQREDS